MNPNLANERIGAINTNNYGSAMEVVEYKSNKDILVKFQQGKPVHTSWACFLKGKV